MYDNGLNCGRWVKVTIGNYCTGVNDGAPGQPFIGFGKVDPTRGIYYQQTNSTWTKYIYTGLEVTVSRRGQAAAVR